MRKNMGRTCCFTGYRPAKLTYLHRKESGEYRRLYEVLTSLIREAVAGGYDHFISGMAQGIDLMAAKILLELKAEGVNLTFEAALPGMNQTHGWSADACREYYALLDQADARHCVAGETTRYSCLKRNDYMIAKSDLVIAVFDGKKGGTAYTVKQARKKNRDLWLIDPVTFEVTREEGLFGCGF
mgnify:FL=1